MKNFNFKKYTRKSIYTELDQFCSFASIHKQSDFMEITEWKNGEGYDIHINNVMGISDFKLTHGEFKALKSLIEKLEEE